MNTKLLDGNTFKTLLINGCQSLINDIDRINALNVFPVPDGDTGTNMRLTLEGGVKSIINENENDLSKLSKTLARAMTFSARGNSGVILSQFFKGLSNGLETLPKATANDLVKAFDEGVKQSYKVVKRPTEGTILTVMKDSTNYCKETIDENSTIEDFFASFLKEAHASLERTPDLLPVLKEAGVIDSGGAGFNRIIEGMIMALDGNILVNQEKFEEEKAKKSVGHFNADSVLEYGYCTEFILQLQNSKVDIKTFELKQITDYLEKIGNSIVAFKDDDIVKVHVHTFTPGLVINFCQKFGEYITFKMENMSVQHSELGIANNEKPKEHKKYVVIAVAPNDNLGQAFKDLGADEIVFGGQTMNPSSEDFVEAFERFDAENIIVFPNNSNIILAAQQAADNYEKANVVLIPTTSLVQCYCSLTMLDLGLDDLDMIVNDLTSTAKNVISLAITKATRNSNIQHVDIHKDDYIALIDKNIVKDNNNKINVVIEALKTINDILDKDVITIIYGKDVSDDEKQQLETLIKQNFPNLEIGTINGQQDVYNFLIAIE